jgi:S1-C subfamily serine protease
MTANPNPMPPAASADASLADRVDQVGAAVVGVVVPRRGVAAGVVWRSGAVVTTASAVGRAERVGVVRADGGTVEGSVRGVDAATDLALVVADVGDAPAERRAAALPRVGDAVFAVGREASGRLHASFGRVGAAGPAWRTWRGGSVDALVRLDGGLYPGLAGAAVADAAGLVVGVASPALSRHHGVVLPWATVDRIAEALQAHGQVSRGYLGIAAQPVTLPASQAGGPGDALLVAGMADDGPAARAGLLVGDIVLSAGGQRVADVESLRQLLAAQPAGTRLRLQVSRAGQPLEVGVDVGERRRRACH